MIPITSRYIVICHEQKDLIARYFYHNAAETIDKSNTIDRHSIVICGIQKHLSGVVYDNRSIYLASCC